MRQVKYAYGKYKITKQNYKVRNRQNNKTPKISNSEER